MKVESRTLSEQPFGFDIRWPFPTDERKLLESALSAVTIGGIADIGELESRLNAHLVAHGYLWDKTHQEECRVWRPDFQHSVDFIQPAKLVAIEVEKTEVKRIVHDVLKLMNASLTFVPRVRFGVLIYPKTYKRSSERRAPSAASCAAQSRSISRRCYRTPDSMTSSSLSMTSSETSNFTLERSDGSHSLAAAAQRGRWTDVLRTARETS